MKRPKVLIVATLPPPIGGVTVHINRYLKKLKQNGYAYNFFDYKRNNAYQFIASFLRHKVIHFHISNYYVKFTVLLVSKIFRKKTINTFHGSTVGKSKFAKIVEILSFYLSNVVIVLNHDMYELSSKYNINTILLSAYIEPDESDFDSTLEYKLEYIIPRYHHLFCTNAYDVTKDASGREIYGISDLINLFNYLPQYCLIVSDPSSNYQQFVTNNKIEYKDNIIFITGNHSFVSVLSKCDSFIRSTTTDGDSLSIHEALSLNKIVFASNCIDRPEGIILFKTGDMQDLSQKITEYIDVPFQTSNYSKPEDIIVKLCKIYDDLQIQIN